MEQIERYNEKNNILFYKIIHNIVLFKIILNELKIYRIYNKVTFKSKKSLIEHPYRNYIESIIYDNKLILKENDLPKYGVLKSIYIHNTEKGRHYIPHGVEYIKFNSIIQDTKLSDLPSTIKTIKKYGINNDVKQKIPPNVTSLSLRCLKITDNRNDGKLFSIPNTIRKLKFIDWYNEDIPLNKGDIPDGITSLDLNSYSLAYYHKVEGILPNSIKHLKIDLANEMDRNIETQFFKLLPSNLESLNLRSFVDLTPDIGFKNERTTTIKTLAIQFFNDSIVQPNSLPSSSLTDLSLKGTHFPIVKGIIPNGVTSLKLSFIYDGIEIGAIPSTVKSLLVDFPIYTPTMFPPNLTHLEFYRDPEEFPYEYEDYDEDEDQGNDEDDLNSIVKAKQFTEENINMMIYCLPNSVTTLILPLEFQSYDLYINKFKYVYYRNIYFLK